MNNNGKQLQAIGSLTIFIYPPDADGKQGVEIQMSTMLTQNKPLARKLLHDAEEILIQRALQETSEQKRIVSIDSLPAPLPRGN